MIQCLQSSSLPTQKTKIECAKNEINALKSQQVQIQNHRNCSLSTAQTFGQKVFIQIDSGIRNQLQCEHTYPAIHE